MDCLMQYVYALDLPYRFYPQSNPCLRSSEMIEELSVSWKIYLLYLTDSLTLYFVGGLTHG